MLYNIILYIMTTWLQFERFDFVDQREGKKHWHINFITARHCCHWVETWVVEVSIAEMLSALTYTMQYSAFSPRNSLL